MVSRHTEVKWWASWFTNSVLGGLAFTFQQGQETGSQTKERKTEEEERREERPCSLPQTQQAALLALSKGGIEIKGMFFVVRCFVFN